MTGQELRPSGRGQASATVAGRLEEIPRVRAWVDEFAARHGVLASDAAMISLALDEIITNICSYAFVDGGEHAILLSLTLKDGVLTTSIEDDGPPFNPLEVEAPDPSAPLDEREPGGLGLFLVRSVVDDITYKRRRRTNLLTLIKKVGKADGAGPTGKTSR